MGYELDSSNEQVKMTGVYVCDKRLFLTDDGTRLVDEGDPDAATLFCTPGMELPLVDAVRLGLAVVDASVKQVDHEADKELHEPPVDKDDSDSDAGPPDSPPAGDDEPVSGLTITRDKPAKRGGRVQKSTRGSK